MAKSVWTLAVSWSAAAAMALSTVAPDAAAAAQRFSFGGGGYMHGASPGGNFGGMRSSYSFGGMRSGYSFGGFRPGLGADGQRSFFRGNQSGGECGIGGPRCGGGDGTYHQDPPHGGGFRPRPIWGGPGRPIGGGFGPQPFGGGAYPDLPPDDPGYDGPDGPVVAAAPPQTASQGGLAGGERLVREFSEAARLALGRCAAIDWPANGAPIDEAAAKRLRCVGDALAVYADKLEDIAPILPEKMRSAPAALKAAAKKVRVAKTKAEASAAIKAVTAEVHKEIALLKADDPVVQSIATREAGQITKTLEVADAKLEKAVGL
jgi:hypothetical protein